LNQLEAVTIVRWFARLLSLAMLLLWGAFFVEHTVEWFDEPWRELPPAHVTLGHMLHFLMLASFLVAWKWEGIGGGMIVLFAVLFFVRADASHFIPFTIVPGLLFLVCWYWSWHASRRTA
jgi:hypothetical protein